MSEPTHTPEPRPARGRLTRSADDRMIAGVCGGLARSVNVDVTVVRVLCVVALVLGVLPVVVAYAALWALVPQE